MGNTNRSEPWSGQQTWHLARWGVLGWAETAVKLVAIAIALRASLAGNWAVPEQHATAYWVLTAIAVSYVLAIADRWIDRELFALVFLLAMILGHGAMLRAMGGEAWPAGALRGFAAGMLLGDLIKIVWFVTSGARVRDLPRWLPIAMTCLLACAYLVLLLAA